MSKVNLRYFLVGSVMVDKGCNLGNLDDEAKINWGTEELQKLKDDVILRGVYDFDTAGAGDVGLFDDDNIIVDAIEDVEDDYKLIASSSLWDEFSGNVEDAAKVTNDKLETIFELVFGEGGVDKYTYDDLISQLEDMNKIIVKHEDDEYSKGNEDG